jgi:hypothetical protein
MMMTARHRSTGSTPCPNDTFCTTNPTSTDLGLSPGLHNCRPPSNRTRGKAFSLAVTAKDNIITLGKRNEIQVRSTNHYETLHDVFVQSQYTVTCVFWKVHTTSTNWIVIWLGLRTQNDWYRWQLPAAFVSWASFERRRN